MTPPWQPYREPLRTTLVRTATIAVVLGALLARLSGGGLSRWPLTTLLMLWPSFGGHWVELWFLNWLRPRLSVGRAVQVAARVGVWFVGGTVLALGMGLTAMEMRLFSQLGGEVSEYDRQCQRPSICRPMPMYCPGW